MTPVGPPEIAARLGVARATVDKWKQRQLLPEPRWTVGGRPAWAWGDIVQWATQTGRIIPVTPETITTDQIQALAAEAEAHNDYEQVTICVAAIDGDPDAIAECVRVINQAKRAAANDH